MPKKLKIALSIAFVLSVAFFAARSCWHVEIKFTPKKAVVKTAAKKTPARPAAKKETPLPMPAAEGKIAIVLDDWGINLPLVQDAVAIGRPLTLSVLPHLAHSHDIAAAAKKSGLAVMLHMPMQAKNLKAVREPRTILTTTPDEEIRQYLDSALENVGLAEGVNNHQGSAATSDERVMRTVLKHLKGRGLFFMDSQVIATSVGKKMAAETGILFVRRDVFIDNIPTLEAVKQKLRDAAKIALSHGRAVVIGHDKKPTLEAIREMVPELEREGVKLVFVRELVE